MTLIKFPKGATGGTGILTGPIWMIVVDTKVEVTLASMTFRERNRKRLLKPILIMVSAVFLDIIGFNESAFRKQEIGEDKRMS